MMKRLTWILTLLAFCLGCNLFDNGVRTLVVEPIQYCTQGDKLRTHHHHEKLAQAAWEEFCRVNEGHEFSTGLHLRIHSRLCRLPGCRRNGRAAAAATAEILGSAGLSTNERGLVCRLPRRLPGWRKGLDCDSWSLFPAGLTCAA